MAGITWPGFNLTDWLKSSGASGLKGYAEGTNSLMGNLGNWQNFQGIQNQLQGANPTWANLQNVQGKVENLLGGWNNYQGIQNQINSNFQGFGNQAATNWGNYQGIQGQIGNLLGQYGNQNALSQYVNNLTNALGESAGREFSQNIIPALQAKGIQSGNYGSSRQGIAEGLASSEAQKNLTNAIANLQYNAAEAERGRGLQANLAQANSLQEFAKLWQGSQEAERNRALQSALAKGQSLQEFAKMWQEGQKEKALSQQNILNQYTQGQQNYSNNLVKLLQQFSTENIQKAGLGATAAGQFAQQQSEQLSRMLAEALGKGNIITEIGKLGQNESQFGRQLLFGAAQNLTQAQQSALNQAMGALGQYPELVKALKSQFGL